MRDRVTGKRIEDHTIPDADQLKEQQDLKAEAIGDFIGDTVAVTQHKVITCIECDKSGGTLVKVGDDLYAHCDCVGLEPTYNRATRRKLGLR